MTSSAAMPSKTTVTAKSTAEPAAGGSAGIRRRTNAEGRSRSTNYWPRSAAARPDGGRRQADNLRHREDTGTGGEQRGSEVSPAQVLAGSATASRKALDRLNAALKSSILFGMTRSGDVKMCRLEDYDVSLDSGAMA